MHRPQHLLLLIGALSASLFLLSSVEHQALVDPPEICFEENESPGQLPEILDPVRDNLIALVNRMSVPSVAVGVAHKGNIIWEEAFGCADMAGKRMADENTPYSTASITKPVTAMAVMRLAEQGLIDLDEPISRYLDGAEIRAYRGEADSATVRRVLNHTGGLPLHHNFFYEDDPSGRPEFDESVRRFGILTFEPGERYNYSNFGYGLLDQLIENVSGKSYEDYLREEIFLPLGMDNSFIGVLPVSEDPRAVRYDELFEPIPDYDFDHRGGSALYSSVHDLLRLGMYSTGTLKDMNQNPVSGQSLEEMQQPGVMEYPGASSGYGLGWSIRFHESGLKEVFHTGGMAGVRTILLTVPEEELVVSVLVNSNNSISILMAQMIAHMLLPGLYDNPLLSGSRESPGDLYESGGNWLGSVITYNGSQEMKLTIDPETGSRVQLGSHPAVTLVQPRIDNNGYLLGIFRGDFGMTDTADHPYVLYINLRLNGDELYGSVTAISTGSDRVRFALSGYAELTRVEE
jgi:CubicO group peptidase (beta-lactamase class C family)